jgi:hypothetical protein
MVIPRKNPAPSYDEKDLLNRAIAAHFRNAPDGVMVPQPSNVDSHVTEDEDKVYVVLANATGVLAVYRLRNDGALKRLKRPPKKFLD